MLGACAPAKVAEAVCGPAGRPAEGGCAARACPAGAFVDVGAGTCSGPGALRGPADAMEITLLPDETLGCPDGYGLVVSGAGASCVALEATCGPGSAIREGKRCAPIAACAPGEVREPLTDACVRIASGATIDVATWARAAIGSDGGEGSSFVCGALALDPRGLTSTTDQRVRLVLGVDLLVPDNDVSQVRARVTGLDQATGERLAPETVARVERVVSRLLEVLRAIGGTARAAAISTRVRCSIPIGPRPMATSTISSRSTTATAT